MSGVGFVCPVYNKAPHLPGVVAAMFAQQGAFERQYIFVNDGSTDDRAVSAATETAGPMTSMGTHGDSDFPRFKDRGKRSGSAATMAAIDRIAPVADDRGSPRPPTAWPSPASGCIIERNHVVAKVAVGACLYRRHQPPLGG